MRRTSLATILVFVAGLGVGYFARGAVGTLQQRYTQRADLGMIDKVSSTESLMKDARELSLRLAGKDAAAFRSIKNLLRVPVAEDMARNEERSVQEFVSIWYSESTWQNLRGITIHS